MNLKDRLYHIFSIRWIQHLSFWTVFLSLEFGRILSSEWDKVADKLLFEGAQQVFIIFLVYFNLRVLIPKFWNTGNYSKYILSITCVSVIVIACLSVILYNFPEAHLKPFFREDYRRIIMMNTFKTNIFVLSTSLFHFVKEWIALKDENLRYTENAQKQLAAELSLLKAQVNPHFLFNTLNNIYSMSLYDSSKTPDMILKLSQLISYMLYECKDEEVNLEKEVQFIENYIDLEAVRVEDIAKINLTINGDDPGHKVPPLLFIPLIENAFKHGISTELSSSIINIKLDISNNKINLEINNPIDSSVEDQKKNKLGGLGIENVKKRLELLYPKNHSFNIYKDNNLYTTKLSLIVK